MAPGASSWATLAALTAFTMVVLSRRHQYPAVLNTLRLTAFWLTAFLGLLELSGPLTVAAGWFELSQDPTAARSVWDDDLINGPPLVLCLVLAVLAGLLAVVLRNGGAAGEAALQSGAAHTTSTTPRPDEPRKPATGEDPQGIFRRPSR